jgi:hypothetical protein
LLAQGSPPPIMLFEDVVDIADFLDYAGRTVPSSWAEEVVVAMRDESLEAFEGLI